MSAAAFFVFLFVAGFFASFATSIIFLANNRNPIIGIIASFAAMTAGYGVNVIVTQMDFNLNLATKENSDNPIYYIEYANARISQILKNTKQNNCGQLDEYTYLDNENTYNILNKLYEFKEVIINASEKRLPHLIANYVYELASLFHSYYTKEKVITDNEEETKEKIALLKAIKTVLNNGLDLIGIIPREEM